MSLPNSLVRRLARVLTAALVPVLVAGCAYEDETQPAPAPAPAAAAQEQPELRRFVGSVPEANGALLAVLVDKDTAGSPQVRAYLCDSSSIFEWFKGSPAGTDVSLSSAKGAALRASVGAGDVTGKITLPDGRAFDFRAAQATGFADLFDVRSASDGSITGTSDAGGRITGRISGEKRPDGMYPASATVRSATGQELVLDLLVGRTDLNGARWIVSGDGQTLHGTDVHPIQTVRGAPIRN